MKTSLPAKLQADFFGHIQIKVLENEAVPANTGTFYFMTNSQGWVTALTNSTGDVIERYHYTPYGTVSFHNPDNTGKSSDRSDFENPYLYGGYRYDPETGFYYCNARYYNPKQGRFISRDPLGAVDGMNLLEYCGSNPVNMVDPLGFRKNIAELKERIKTMAQAMERRQADYYEFSNNMLLAREKRIQLQNKQAWWKSHLPSLYKAKEKYGYESINELIKEHETKTAEYQELIDKQNAEVLFHELQLVLPEKLYKESLADLDQAYQDLIAEMLREESVLEKTGDFAYDSTIGELLEKSTLIGEQIEDIRNPTNSLTVKVISGGVAVLSGILLYLEFGTGGIESGGKKLSEKAGNLVTGSLKSSKSYSEELANKTYQEIIELSRGTGDIASKAKKMKKLIEQGERLRNKLKK